MAALGFCILNATIIYCWWKAEDNRVQRAHEIELATIKCTMQQWPQK